MQCIITNMFLKCSCSEMKQIAYRFKIISEEKRNIKPTYESELLPSAPTLSLYIFSRAKIYNFSKHKRWNQSPFLHSLPVSTVNHLTVSEAWKWQAEEAMRCIPGVLYILRKDAGAAQPSLTTIHPDLSGRCYCN